MGGQAESVITPQKVAQAPQDHKHILMPPTAPPQPTPTVGKLEQAIRFHISNNEVHFHVDPGTGPNTERLKVAIPVAEWWTAFERLKNLRSSSYQYIDHNEGVMLQVEAGINEDGLFEVVPSLSKVGKAGPIFKKLEDFTYEARTETKKKKKS